MRSLGTETVKLLPTSGLNLFPIAISRKLSDCELPEVALGLQYALWINMQTFVDDFPCWILEGYLKLYISVVSAFHNLKGMK